MERIDQLQREFTDCPVTIDAASPELQRFAGRAGQVKTVNRNGRALVQFEGNDTGWYDIAVEHLRLAEPAPEK